MSDTTSTSTGEAPASGPVPGYDVPQDIAYSGQSFIDLGVPHDFFVAQAAPDQEDAS